MYVHVRAKENSDWQYMPYSVLSFTFSVSKQYDLFDSLRLNHTQLKFIADTLPIKMWMY